MDLGDIWNSEVGHHVLDVWSESMEGIDLIDLLDDDLVMDSTRDFIRDSIRDSTSDPTTATPSILPNTTTPMITDPVRTPQTPENQTSHVEAESMSRWVGVHFNKPAGMHDKRPPMLLKFADIESTRRFELYRLHSVGFELSNGDTLVIIDFPRVSTATRNHADCNGIAYRSQQFRVHSQNLLDTNSTKFTEMLGPTHQFRTLRRRKLVNKLPAGVKYLLDLTPPSEGDELVFQMTELSLTPGILKWWSSSTLHEVDSWLVCGHDDICMCDRARFPKDEESMEQGSPTQVSPKDPGIARLQYSKNNLLNELPLDPDLILQMKVRDENEIYETPDFRRIPDYCPVRHRNGIIRLLMLVEGKGVSLDSASRVWTLVRLCKVFDCTSLIRDRVAQWIMHGPNTRFIEVLPEEALQIAFALELPGVAQSAFRILVNELALKEADNKVSDKKPTQTTVFGRKLGDLPDELSNLVQHSARAFIERMSNVDANLRNPDMFDYWDIEEWNRLRAIEQLLSQEKSPTAAKALAKIQGLMQALVYEITETYDFSTSKALSTNVHAYNSIDQDRATYVEPKDYERLAPIIKNLSPVQRLLCSLTYNELGSNLESTLYFKTRSRVPDQKRMLFSLLVDNAANAVQEVIDENLMLAQSEAWAPCFDSNCLDQYTVIFRPVRRPLIDLNELELSIKDRLRPITLSWIRHEIDPPLNITRHLLLTLTNNEMKFLPLWAGGCDDGTGGVFETQIPPATMGPNGPGPSYHTGMTIPSLPSSGEGSMIEDLAELRLWGSTTVGSVDVHDSISTVYRPDRVIADDVSMASEAFTAGGAEYQAAKFEVPADHQSMGSAVDMLIEDADWEVQSTTADRELTPTGDDDTDFWNEESDSDDSVVMVGE
ncbi:hypothetical protein G7Z17_g9886 [Cylindrodendrum hubeiense]|uniref:Uncharacterized protein n=1 Tax=Cylindrodendrum hubeiense TaxID=595255 RepID=A0A9P5H2G6_9HYPO|nr:hypothetical protein G7Z17_g9886 [Cylindrodendrum hubeiense]